MPPPTQLLKNSTRLLQQSTTTLRGQVSRATLSPVGTNQLGIPSGGLTHFFAKGTSSAAALKPANIPSSSFVTPPLRVSNNTPKYYSLPIANNLTLRSTAIPQQEEKLLGPRLPVLEAIYQKIMASGTPPNFENVIFVCGQHLLNTTVSLFEFLIRLGAKPENIFVVGKSYSNNQKVIEQLKELKIYHQRNSKQQTLGEFSAAYNADIVRMWEKVSTRSKDLQEKGKPIDGFIVLDDGGHVITYKPEELDESGVYIEQTTSGRESAELMGKPTITLAASFIKTEMEPKFVSEQICLKLESALKSIKPNEKFELRTPSVIGIVGLGNVGMNVLNHLIRKGYKDFIVFDKSPKKCEQVTTLYPKSNVFSIVATESIADLIGAADIIVSTTGQDGMANNLKAFELMRSPKIFISCSSKDVEFRTLLAYIQKCQKGKYINPLEDIEFQNGFKAPLKIIRGGTPINFDNSEESVPASKIQLVRGLKAIAILQAFDMLQYQKRHGRIPVRNYKLDPEGQAFVAATWLNFQSSELYPKELREQYTSIRIISEGSAGELYDPKNLDFSNTNSNATPRNIR